MTFPAPSFTPEAIASSEQALQKWDIPYTKMPDGSLLVEVDIDIRAKDLSTLPDFSCVYLRGEFQCYDNDLISLIGSPFSVEGTFWGGNNPALTSLEGAPSHVGGDFWCASEKLTSLEGAPKTFKVLVTNFGYFNSWDEVPEHLRVSPQTIARQAREERESEEKLAAELAEIHGAIHGGLKEHIPASKPLSFNKLRGKS